MIKTLICFIFVGHSNMLGGWCNVLNERTDNPNIFFYSHTSNSMGKQGGRYSVEQPFLEEMSSRYPNHRFVGVRNWLGASSVNWFMQEESTLIKREIASLRDSVIFGGVVSMQGIVECDNSDSARLFKQAFFRMVDFMRRETGNKNLPIILGQLEIHAQKSPYKYIVMDSMQTIERADSRVKLAPAQPLPVSLYCDDHHYTDAGYRFLAKGAVSIYKMNRFDFWSVK